MGGESKDPVNVSLSDWQARVRASLKRWEGAFGLDPDPLFFEGVDGMPDFHFEGAEEFSASTAWWLGELCRLAYTPDDRERGRRKYDGFPQRDVILETRTPFKELVSIHKTGNHASIYRRRDDTGPTIVCFRGTNRTRQWVMNAVVRPHRWKRYLLDGDPEEAYVHSGFYVFLKRVWPLIEQELAQLPRPWIVTGHSLGGALAMLVGPIVHPELICTFGAPKVGNETFYQLRTGNALWRLVNHTDLVPHLPLRDRTAGVRNFSHGHPASILGNDSGISPGVETDPGGVLPVLAANSKTGLKNPPQWLIEHRIGEYCRKLQRLHHDGCRIDSL
ncbi:lipase family protein [Verrucomicrobiales bacterium BCK34]|nr:lipase family protein [Verrucomicrobiales bacterium BCK34]